MKKIFILLSSLLLISACELENNKNNAKNKIKNTIGNLEECIKQNSSDLVKEDVTKFNCIAKLSNKVEDKTEGSAGPKNDFGGIQHSGYFENLSTDIIYTSVTVEFYHTVDYDENNKNCRANSKCKKYLFSEIYDKLWLQPGESESFRLILNEENLVGNEKIDPALELKNFVSSKQTSETRKSNWYWETSNVKGFYLQK